METPIEKKLSDEGQIGIAKLQDSCIEAIYSVDPSAVLHGGTAIWRCYSGNRFSDDIDIYLRTNKEINEIRNKLTFAMNRRDATITKSAVIGNYSIFTVEGGEAEIKLEMGKNMDGIRPVERNYEKVNGTYISILTLTPEDFIIEKVQTYKSRKYVRDLYDIYHLSASIPQTSQCAKVICSFLKAIQKPVDENALKSIVYAGAAPSFDGMVDAIRGRFCEVH
jgi:predicted nucleotidyltransferase component of viral defense system